MKKTILRHIAFFLLLLLCGITACTPRPISKTNNTFAQNEDGHATTLLRADPGYIQWLEKQSLLHEAKNAIALVSGSNLTWKHNGNMVNPYPLLQKTSIWIDIEPQNIDKNNTYSALKLLSQASITTALQQKDFSLYLSNIQDTESVWSSNDITNRPISYSIAKKIGTEKELENVGMYLRPQLLATDIIPASTGLGPDFFLAARGHKDYIGAYAMIEIPPHDWSLLPHIQDDWQCQALTKKQQKSLAKKGWIPERLYRNKNTSNTSSWAATGTIRGVDGNARRWVYAYAENPMQPILHWNDPSGLARRIFSASIIKNTGLLGLPLVGLSLEDLYGFEPTLTGKNAKNSESLALNAEPMLTAAQALAHEIRSYGGWSWLRQSLPTNLLAHFMPSMYHTKTGPDFFTSQIENSLQKALEQNQATPLHAYFDELLAYHINSTRLAHILPTVPSYQDTLLAATFLASQSGLVFYPDAALLPLANMSTDNVGLQSPKSFTIETLQQSILALPDFASWRETCQVATAKLLDRLASSQASLALLSALPQHAPDESVRYLLSVTNLSGKDMYEQISLANHFPQTNLRVQEIDISTGVPSDADIGDTSTFSLEIPAKTCRIFILTKA